MLAGVGGSGQAVPESPDTGVGIPAVDQERIFERFYRTAIVRRQEIPGTGLGLTITKAIVAAQNGTIAVESAEGGGSTFTIRLPLTRVPAIDTEEPSPVTPPDQHPIPGLRRGRA
jgi:signal transduction histidine kinase